MKEEMAAETREITEAVAKNVLESINEKLTALVEENKSLKTEVKILHEKIKQMEEHIRKNNIIFGVKEEQHNESLDESTIILLERNLNIHIVLNEINNAYRLGEKKNNKPRPISLQQTGNEMKYSRTKRNWIR
ncbi:unnamed protein product [Parnassius apollo]|uniref:(apollo) hypothetical protein n=1 Tax=Parnassius apollo TaxID=110799 RepID=A0A8S3YD44_PARAO|nr:unnamed protein product [Parnassius apollo]